MAIENELTGELIFNVLYVGAPGSGKSANLVSLQNLYLGRKTPVSGINSVTNSVKNLVTNSAAGSARLLRDSCAHGSLEFLPLHLLASPLGEHSKFRLVHLFCLPSGGGFPQLESVLLQVADAVVFVVDSRCENMEKNHLALGKFVNQCEMVGKRWPTIPTVFQFNHADGQNTFHPESLLSGLGHVHPSRLWQEAVAADGKAVYETLVTLLNSAIGTKKTSRTEFDKIFPSSYLPEFFRRPPV